MCLSSCHYLRQRHMALLDSWSNMSQAPATLVRLEDLSTFQERLYAANGTSIRVVGEAVLHRRVGDI